MHESMNQPTYAVLAAAFAPAILMFHGQAAGAVADHYFDAPTAGRADGLVGTLLEEEPVNMDKTLWRTPRSAISVPEAGEEREVSEHDGVRKMHTRLVANAFAVHPDYGPGHVLRTDGRVAAFWTGERTYVVHFTNLKFVRVTVGRLFETKAPQVPKATGLTSKVLAALNED